MALFVFLAGGASTAWAQSCIALAGSTQCSAFNASSISTDPSLTGLFPFLSGVTDVASFDSGIQDYIANGFTQTRYGTLLGCDNVASGNSSEYYARYTTSVVCNAIVQNSITPCGLTGNAARPLCADSCADYAQSEQEITNSNVCSNPDSGALTQVRADFTNCALPADSLTGACIEAYQNQPDNCGFTNNIGSLCSYCAASSPNSTDSCCVFSNTTSICQGVSLPVVASSALQPVTVTSTALPGATSSTSASSVAHSKSGLTGGQIAGIVVGSVFGALLLLGLIIAGCLLFRRRRSQSPDTIFNQPSTTRPQPQMAYNDTVREPAGATLTALPRGRVARMAALEASSGEENNGTPYGAGGAFAKTSISSEDDTPESRGYGLAPPTATGKRSGSLSSGSQFAMAGAQDTSPSSGVQEDTSPESGGQSEQLGFFKDYYSQDEIHPSDIVATLWAYDPRAADEFHLERGDMIKVLGIWDDGWATGVRVRQRAEDWRPEDKIQRDSGMSNGSSRPPPTAEEEGEVKAFPLVCVCLPQHWRKTIEGESTEGSGAAHYPEMP